MVITIWIDIWGDSGEFRSIFCLLSSIFVSNGFIFSNPSFSRFFSTTPARTKTSQTPEYWQKDPLFYGSTVLCASNGADHSVKVFRDMAVCRRQGDAKCTLSQSHTLPIISFLRISGENSSQKKLLWKLWHKSNVCGHFAFALPAKNDYFARYFHWEICLSTNTEYDSARKVWGSLWRIRCYWWFSSHVLQDIWLSHPSRTSALQTWPILGQNLPKKVV